MEMEFEHDDRASGMSSLAATLRGARVIHGALVAASFFYVLLIMFQFRPHDRPVDSVTLLAFAVTGLACGGFALFFRKQKVMASAEQLQFNPQDADALREWSAGIVLSLVLAETIVLFGFVLKLLGSQWTIAAPFFVVGTALMVLWTPRLDLPSRA